MVGLGVGWPIRPVTLVGPGTGQALRELRLAVLEEAEAGDPGVRRVGNRWWGSLGGGRVGEDAQILLQIF